LFLLNNIGMWQNVRRTGANGQRGDRPGRAGYSEPAFARGYSDGYEKGADDGRDREGQEDMPQEETS